MPTRSYAIFRTLGQPGWLNYGQAMALSTRLMLVVDRWLTMFSPGFRCPRSPLLHHALR